MTTLHDRQACMSCYVRNIPSIGHGRSVTITLADCVISQRFIAYMLPGTVTPMDKKKAR
jgi:hypothetical protein